MHNLHRLHDVKAENFEYDFDVALFRRTSINDRKETKVGKSSANIN